MAITYAGFNLLLEDPGKQARRFIRRHIDQRQNALFGAEPAAIASQRQNPNSSGAAPVTIPVYNYPERPPIRVNQLYWPTGAMRWGCFLGLCDGGTLNSIVNAINEEVTEDPPTYTVSGADLVIDDETGSEPITAYMHLLTPRKITPPGATLSTSEELWLLPLVDVRYFFQQTDYEPRDSGAEPEYGSDFWTDGTWNGVFDFIGAQVARLIGRPTPQSTIQIDRTPPSGYLTPYGTEFRRPSECPALLLDAAAANVGCRVILDLPGRDVIQPATDDEPARNVSVCIRITDPETAERDFLNNMGDFINGKAVTAGDQIDGINDCIGATLPDRVRLCFRDTTQSYVSQRIDTYVTDLADPPSQWKDHSIKVIHDTFYCPPATWDGGAEAHNADSGISADQTTVERAEALAYLIAEDYYKWQRRRYDVVLPGIVSWRLTGYDDAILWTMGTAADGRLVCSTRVWTYPPDVYPCTMTHGDSTGGGPWYQVVSHPFTADGGATGSDNGSYRLDRSEHVWCLPLPFEGEDGTIRWAAETGDISLDGASYDPGNGMFTTFGVDLPLRKVYFNRPWAAVEDSRFAEFVGALFPGEVFRANAEQTAVEIPGAANHSVTGTVTAVAASGIEILLANGSKILAERTAPLDTWAVDDSAICWFAEGRYIAANTTCADS